jgi:hypothetical protein
VVKIDAGKSSIVFVPPQSIRPNPDNIDVERLLARLLVPELTGHRPWEMDQAEMYGAICRWLATSELLKFCASAQWHHPAICPKKYPRGWKKSAEALGKLWIKVWQICHRWFDSADALWVFEAMTREYGGLLTPYSWHPDPNVEIVSVVLVEGDYVPHEPGARRAARPNRKKGDTPERYINQAGTAIRRWQNPYLPDTMSFALIRKLISVNTPETKIQLNDLAAAIKTISLLWKNGPAVGGGLRYNLIEKQVNSYDWPTQRKELLVRIQADGLGTIFGINQSDVFSKP